jgi:hypothetical protein
VLRKLFAGKRTDSSSGPAKDAAQLQIFAQLGTDLSRSRAVDHSFVLPTSVSAARLARALQEREPDAAVRHDGRWVHATVRMPLSAELIAKRRTNYEALAKHFGGKYDGWGASADPRLRE